MNFLKTSENLESINDTFEVVKSNIENANQIIANWKCIRDRFKNLYEKRYQLFERAIDNHVDSYEILVLQMELKATKAAFDDAEKEYQMALTLKISLETTISKIEQIYQSNLENKIIEDPEKIN